MLLEDIPIVMIPVATDAKTRDGDVQPLNFTFATTI